MFDINVASLDTSAIANTDSFPWLDKKVKSGSNHQKTPEISPQLNFLFCLKSSAQSIFLLHVSQFSLLPDCSLSDLDCD